MPEVAAGATHAVISKWLVTIGQQVAIGDILAEIETDKAVVEYASEQAGFLLELLAKEGQEVEVGSIMAVIGEKGESVSSSPDSSQSQDKVAQVVIEAQPAVALVSPIATVQSESVAESPTGQRVFISPLARKYAKDNNLDISKVSGTGPGGRIVKRDLEAVSAAAPDVSVVQTQSASKELASQEYSSSYSTIPHSGMRKAIARRLTESKSTVPHFYLTADCLVDELEELRNKVNQTSPIRISVNDMVIRAVAAAFQDVPDANVVWTKDAMLRYESVDISVAVATEGGLLTPVIRGVEKRSLSNISATVKELADKSRSGRLRQEDLEGGSFAVTNLGMYGTTEFSAILNPPQSGILAVGAARSMPVVRGGEIVVARVMTVTLSADHRAVDGALAAQWLAAFQARIENPLSMLI